MRKSTPFILLAMLLLAPISLASEYWCTDQDEIYADVAGSTVTIFHQAAFYICGEIQFEFDFSVDPDAGQIDITENFIVIQPAYCFCCYESSVAIDDVPPGEYTVNFTWYDEESNDWVIYQFDVSVADVGQTDAPRVSDTAYSGCLPEMASVEDEEPGADESDSDDDSTWGRLKECFK